MLSHFTVRQLKALWSYNPEIGSAEYDRDVHDFFMAHPPTDRDRKLAYALANEKRSGTLLTTSNLYETAWTAGARVLSSAENIEILRSTGESTVLRNAVIPNVDGEVGRPGLYTLVAFLSTFFKYSGSTKRIELISQMQTLEEAWGVAQSCVKIDGLVIVQRMFIPYIETSQLWSSYADHQRASLTGPRWISFLTSLFNSCPWDDYLSFHSVFAYDFLKAYREIGGEGNKKYVPVQVKNKEGKNVSLIPASSLIVLETKEIAKLPPKAQAGAHQVELVTKKAPIVCRGPFPAAHQFVDYREATFDKAYKAFGKGNTLRGGDDSGLNLLSSCVGYSGMPTALARHQILLTSSSCFLATKFRELDIYCPSIGVIPLLHSSLLAARMTESFDCDWKFIVSFNDSANVDKDYRVYVLTSFRKDAHKLWISTKVIPSSAKTDEVLLQSDSVMKQVAGPNFTYWGPLFGSAPFIQGRFVYRHGLPSNFHGFCTTCGSFRLFGYEHRGGGSLKSVTISLPLAKTDTEWYSEVIKANSVRNSYFLRAARQYSSISNTIVPPQKGVRFAISGFDLAYSEQGDASAFLDEAYTVDQEQITRQIVEEQYVGPEEDSDYEDDGREDDDDDDEEDEDDGGDDNLAPLETTASVMTTTTQPVMTESLLGPTLVPVVPAPSPPSPPAEQIDLFGPEPFPSAPPVPPPARVRSAISSPVLGSPSVSIKRVGFVPPANGKEHPEAKPEEPELRSVKPNRKRKSVKWPVDRVPIVVDPDSAVFDPSEFGDQ